MIYIVGYTFVVGKPPAIVNRGGSMMRQMSESRLSAKQEPNCPLIIGTTYRLTRIKPIITEKVVTSCEYQFTSLTDGSTKSITYPSTQEADTYIARMSGTLEEYKQLRENASKIAAEL